MCKRSGDDTQRLQAGHLSSSTSHRAKGRRAAGYHGRCTFRSPCRPRDDTLTGNPNAYIKDRPCDHAVSSRKEHPRPETIASRGYYRRKRRLSTGFPPCGTPGLGRMLESHSHLDILAGVRLRMTRWASRDVCGREGPRRAEEGRGGQRLGWWIPITFGCITRLHCCTGSWWLYHCQVAGLTGVFPSVWPKAL